ncbi:MAG TPA: M23 family metallopeptidase [Candidatus Dormibacteraeota bacterium]|nr:M23 family metallopeptidase [Candidatus Dormibacteraeota bacterium]
MRRALVALLLSGLQLMVAPPDPHGAAVPSAVRTMAPAASDVFQLPLPTWSPHCLGFGSQWRYCNGTPLRACADGSVWLHTGTDEVASVGDPVAAAADGDVIGYLVDPTFRGGILVRHATTFGVVITQYWHVWLRSGFTVGSHVKRGQVFADIADMGDKTHFHFAVFMGDYDAHSWNGALPPRACSGFPAFPYRFVDPTVFIEAHAPKSWRSY